MEKKNTHRRKTPNRIAVQNLRAVWISGTLPCHLSCACSRTSLCLRHCLAGLTLDESRQEARHLELIQGLSQNLLGLAGSRVISYIQVQQVLHLLSFSSPAIHLLHIESMVRTESRVHILSSHSTPYLKIKLLNLKNVLKSTNLQNLTSCYWTLLLLLLKLYTFFQFLVFFRGTLFYHIFNSLFLKKKIKWVLADL